MSLLEKTLSWQELPRRYQRLLREAEKAMARAYCPYSGFQVGAAILTHSGEIITGCNFEVVGQSNSICAERVALTAANAQGYGAELKVIAVIAPPRGDSPTREIATSCGSCRQMLYEFALRSDYDLEVIYSTTLRNKIIISRISELLPFPFGPRSLRDEQDPRDLARASAAS